MWGKGFFGSAILLISKNTEFGMCSFYIFSAFKPESGRKNVASNIFIFDY